MRTWGQCGEVNAWAGSKKEEKDVAFVVKQQTMTSKSAEMLSRIASEMGDAIAE